MDPARSNARGVELLRQYLEYAASGGTRLADRGMTGVLANEFEQDVENALRERGIDLLPQYGFSSYRIDLVARHPRRPGALVLAIECDGATYHSAPMARDRDRLRQQHLEALGWRFCRIWSTDWFLRREEEIERVVEAYEAAVRRFDRGGDDVVEHVSAPASPIASNGHGAVVVAPEGPASRGEVAPLAERASPTPSTELEPPRHLATPALGAVNGSAPADNRVRPAEASSLTPLYSSNWQRRSPLSSSGPASRTKGAGPRAKKRVPKSPQHSRVTPYSAPRFNPGAVQAHECFMPGCDHYGPPGTCPVHDQC
jgi:very-short-patch-repair endonuclease